MTSENGGWKGRGGEPGGNSSPRKVEEGEKEGRKEEGKEGRKGGGKVPFPPMSPCLFPVSRSDPKRGSEPRLRVIDHITCTSAGLSFLVCPQVMSRPDVRTLHLTFNWILLQEKVFFCFYFNEICIDSPDVTLQLINVK